MGGLRCTWFKSKDANEPASPSESSTCSPPEQRGGPGEGSPGLGSGERHLPSLCVRAQFAGADDQHARRVHPIQSHLRVQAEPGHLVLQVGPRLLPTLEAEDKSHQPFMQTVEKQAARTWFSFKAMIGSSPEGDRQTTGVKVSLQPATDRWSHHTGI